jgi:hypothetical protein
MRILDGNTSCVCVDPLLQAMRAFKLAGLVDERGAWSGGDTVCVQVSRQVLGRGQAGSLLCVDTPV